MKPAKRSSSIGHLAIVQQELNRTLHQLSGVLFSVDRQIRGRATLEIVHQLHCQVLRGNERLSSPWQIFMPVINQAAEDIDER